MRKNIFKSLGLECNTEHGDACGCAFCIPEDPAHMPEDTPLTEIAADVVEAEYAYENAEAANATLMQSAAALEAICNTIAESQARDYQVTPSDGAMLHVSINAIQKRIGMPSRSIPALECFTGDSELVMQLSLEGLGDFLLRVWEAIKSALVKLYNTILDFLKKLLRYTQSMDRQAARNRTEIAGLLRSGEQVVPTEPVMLSTSAVAALWDIQSGEISKSLIVDVAKYKTMFVECFLKYVDNQFVSDEATNSILNDVIRRADSDLDRGRKKDEKIAKDLIAYSEKKMQEIMGVLATQRTRIFAPFNGQYLGGLKIDSKSQTSNFEWTAFHPSTHVTVAPMQAAELSDLNSAATDLSIAYQNFIDYSYGKLGEALSETTGRLEDKVKDLAENYGDFPKLLQAFRIALMDNKTESNKLINNIYRVASGTSKLCAALHGEVIPSLIESLQTN